MSDRIRIDKWLWQARFFKTRSLSAKVVASGRVRVNAQPISKPAFAVGPGDVLTFPQAHEIRVIRVLAPGARRGPASEARTLYDDLDPPRPKDRSATPHVPKYEGSGRPTKKERRQLDQTRREVLE
ncbi:MULTISPECIES: RNA-binding S4 domain-containing protein [unclassified Roseivivax]|uniref:RNA-binding S4 domain-containing protein n=1 Tax=Roseivivax sp. GX 12232 TaxID=2900547 RepID=UPI001E4EE0DB|nr:RNA-binding S4 domain-containing protein [Roseivivax sp. GX 12232]MCE0503764.1 RNA-binding S4 domain-containing protein [Roseivivax sp. GX 12232]